MMKRSRYVTLIWVSTVSAILAAGCHSTQETQQTHTSQTGDRTGPAHWGYGELDGPATWASLSSDYVHCGEGRSQSPIDLADPKASTVPAWEMEYGTTTLTIAHHEHTVDLVDNGHTIQVTYDEGSMISLEGRSYELKQFHFHTPSEHTVRGRYYPMEMHLVHMDEQGRVAVYGVFIEEGERNIAYEPLVENLPTRPGDMRHLEHITVDIDELMPGQHKAYHYSGSLTTPPCTEGVNWLVAVEPVQVSPEQLSEFSKRLGRNNRPPQPLNGREITMDVIP